MYAQKNSRHKKYFLLICLFDDKSDLLKASISSYLELIGFSYNCFRSHSNNSAINSGVGIYCIVHHNIAPNAGGTSVNEITFIIDIIAAWLRVYII